MSPPHWFARNVAAVLGSTGAAAFEPRQHPRVCGVPLYARGTSYTNGANATAGNSYVTLVAAGLAAPAVHNAAAGGSNTPSLPYQYVENPAHKWLPGTSAGLVVIEAGIGEALSEESTLWRQSRAVFENQLLTALRWHRATAVRKPGHASLALGPGATTETLLVGGAVDANPGIKLNVPGESFTITPGGPAEIVLLGLPWKATAEVENGDYTISVDGGPPRLATLAGRGDTRPDGNNVVVTLCSERITGLSPTSTVTVTKAGGGIDAWFYGYLVMGHPAPPPIVLVQDVPLIESAGQWVGDAITSGPRRNNATLEAYRAIVRRIAAGPEFADGTVAVADPAPRWDATTDLSDDDLHPNDSGHRVYADAVLAAVQSLGR